MKEQRFEEEFTIEKGMEMLSRVPDDATPYFYSYVEGPFWFDITGMVRGIVAMSGCKLEALEQSRIMLGLRKRVYFRVSGNKWEVSHFMRNLSDAFRFKS